MQQGAAAGRPHPRRLRSRAAWASRGGGSREPGMREGGQQGAAAPPARRCCGYALRAAQRPQKCCAAGACGCVGARWVLVSGKGGRLCKNTYSALHCGGAPRAHRLHSLIFFSTCLAGCLPHFNHLLPPSPHSTRITCARSRCKVANMCNSECMARIWPKHKRLPRGRVATGRLLVVSQERGTRTCEGVHFVGHCCQPRCRYRLSV